MTDPTDAGLFCRSCGSAIDPSGRCSWCKGVTARAIAAANAAVLPPDRATTERLGSLVTLRELERRLHNLAWEEQAEAVRWALERLA